MAPILMAGAAAKNMSGHVSAQNIMRTSIILYMIVRLNCMIKNVFKVQSNITVY